MTLTIGRCGLDVTHDNVQSIDDSGDRVQIQGWLYTSSLADAKVLRQQLLGHVNNPDEPVVPVTWSSDSSLDGFYRVTGASVGAQHEQRNYDNFIFPFSVDLERAAPTNAVGQAQVFVVGGKRTNSHGITTAYQALVAGGSSSSAAASDGNSDYNKSRAGEAGTVWAYDANTELGAGTVGSSRSTVAVTPANWYTFAPKLEIGTGTKRVVAGKECDNLPLNWQISNGFLRVSSSGSGSVINVEAHNGTSWSTAKGYQIAAQNALASYVSLGTFSALQILRNGPDKVTIRLSSSMLYFTNISYPARVDISLRRGARHVEILASFGATATSRTWRLLRTSAETGVALTGGVQANANDANGHRYVVAAAGGSANTATGGMEGVASTTAGQFGVGVAIAGSSAVAPDRAQDIAYQFFAAVDEVVGYVGLG